MKEQSKNIVTMTIALVASFVMFLKAQFGINIVPEFYEFSALFIAFGFAVFGIWRNNRKQK